MSKNIVSRENRSLSAVDEKENSENKEQIDVKKANFLQGFILSSLKKENEFLGQEKPSFFPEIDREIEGVKFFTELISEKKPEESYKEKPFLGQNNLRSDQKDAAFSGFFFNILSGESKTPSYIKLVYDKEGKLTTLGVKVNDINAEFLEHQFPSMVSLLAFELFLKLMSSEKKDIGDLEKSTSKMILFTGFLKSEIEKGKKFIDLSNSEEQVLAVKIALASIEDCTKKIIEPFLGKSEKYIKKFMDEYVDPKFLSDSFEKTCEKLRKNPESLKKYFPKSDFDVDKVIEEARDLYETNCTEFKTENTGLTSDLSD